MKFSSVKIGTSSIPWPAFAAFLAAAPMLGVFGMRALSNRKVPATASGAENIVSQGQFVPPTLPNPAPEAVALKRTFDAECAQFGPSPMVHRAPPEPPVKPREVVVPQHTDTSQVQVPRAITPPSVTVTSIMAGQGKPFAVISGKVRRVGDQVGNGFSVVSINGADSTVEIANGDVKVTLTLKSRGAE